MKRPYLVGISGGSGSGKSTLAKFLENELSALKVKVFHLDSYFKSDATRPKAKASVTGKVYFDDNCPETIDHQQFRTDLEAASHE